MCAVAAVTVPRTMVHKWAVPPGYSHSGSKKVNAFDGAGRGHTVARDRDLGGGWATGSGNLAAC